MFVTSHSIQKLKTAAASKRRQPPLNMFPYVGFSFSHIGEAFAYCRLADLPLIVAVPLFYSLKSKRPPWVCA